MSRTPRQILLIDDDKDDVEIFADALKELQISATFHHFNDGHRALEQLKDGGSVHPDIIFLDINMPVIDGWQCLREIKTLAFLGHIPIIMYSTSDLRGKGLSPADVGATAFMTKPDTFRDLKVKLDELLNLTWG